MRLKQLEMILQRVEGFDSPSARREQYGTPATLAARLLYHAMMKGDIREKRVLDLGCGTGILSIGAFILGASAVLGVDIDEKAVESARRNADMLGVEPEFITGDIGDPKVRKALGPCDIYDRTGPAQTVERASGARIHAKRAFGKSHRNTLRFEQL